MTRKMELLLGAALAAAIAAGAQAAEGPRSDTSPAAARPARFAPPSERLVLTREVRRDFARGGELVSRRSYAIHFVPAGSGWRVEGELVGSAVEAPPGIAPELLELERGRSDKGLFPMLLNGDGLIVHQSGGSDPATDTAMLNAAQNFLRGKLGDADRAAAVAMAASLQARARAAGGSWPVDLFRPRRGEHSEVRSLPLTGGVMGRATITIAATDGGDGLLERLERRVVTEAAGSRRLSVETWSLARAR